MHKISPRKIAEIVQELDSYPLNEDTRDILKGLIAGQAFLLDLLEKLVKGEGYQRTKIIREIAKIIEINLKKKDCNLATPNPSSNREDTPPNQPDDLANAPFDDEEKSENSEIIVSEESGSEEKKNDNQLDPDYPSQEKEETTEGENKNLEGTNTGNSTEKEGEKRRKKRGNDEYLPVRSYIHWHETLEPGDQCPECLKGRVYLFRDKVIPVLIGRSPLAYEEHCLKTLRCNACGAIFEPKLPAEVPKTGHSMPSAQAVLTLLHYNIGVPFTSISDFQEMFCQNISTSQLWDVIEHAVQAIEPIYDVLEMQAANSKLFYTDDTTARILSHYPINKENRKKKKRKKEPIDRVGTYSSIIIGCTEDGHEIHLFYHGRKYAGENLSDVLANRDDSLKVPIQMKDASTMNVPADAKVVEAKCNAHAIRKFKDIKEIYPKWCNEVLKLYGEVNDNEQILISKGASDSERLAYHGKHSLPLMQKIKNSLTRLVEDKLVEPNSSLGQAINYFCTHYQELIAFCRIEGAPFDNNKAERSLKKIIRLRKTSMFYKTERGAEIAGKLHSVIHTAQAAGVNALDYLQTLMENPEKVRQAPLDFLPWTFQKTMEEFNKVETPLEESLEPILAGVWDSEEFPFLDLS